MAEKVFEADGKLSQEASEEDLSYSEMDVQSSLDNDNSFEDLQDMENNVTANDSVSEKHSILNTGLKKKKLKLELKKKEDLNLVKEVKSKFLESYGKRSRGKNKEPKSGDLFSPMKDNKGSWSE